MVNLIIGIFLCPKVCRLSLIPRWLRSIYSSSVLSGRIGLNAPLEGLNSAEVLVSCLLPFHLFWKNSQCKNDWHCFPTSKWGYFKIHLSGLWHCWETNIYYSLGSLLQQSGCLGHFSVNHMAWVWEEVTGAWILWTSRFRNGFSPTTIRLWNAMNN